MIITRTPLRVSFLGGGTDFKDFYEKYGGEVVSSAINKYIYICVHKHLDGKKFLLKYSKVEEGEDVNKIEHDLIRECMKMTGVFGVEIVSMSDVPTTGIGLGSSSSFTVGLLNALYAYKGESKSAEELAQKACEIEIDILNRPIGKQDQYIAAYGGMRRFVFLENGQVKTSEIVLSKEKRDEFDSSLLLFYTGNCRSSSNVLSEQKANIPEKEQSLLKVKKMAEDGFDFLSSGNLDKIGGLMLQNWTEKKQWARLISNDKINIDYQKAVDAGALGGKICGAGGGGFFLFYCAKEKQDNVRKALSDLKEFEFCLEPKGSIIIYRD